MTLTALDADTFDVRRRPLWLLLAVCLFGLALNLTFYLGFVAGDDSQYIAGAMEMVDGRYTSSLTDQWKARLGMIGYCALVTKTFGPSLSLMIDLPLVCSLLAIVLAYATAKVVYGDPGVGLLAALFMAVFPMNVFFGTTLFPSMPASAFTGAAFLLFYLAEKRTHGRVLYAASGVALGIAYLYHETTIFTLLPLMVYAVYSRKLHWGYVLAAAGMLGVVVVECTAYWFIAGDALYRYRAFTNSYAYRGTGYGAMASVRPGGYFIAPLLSLVTNHEYGLFYVFILWATGSLCLRRDKPSAAILLWFITVAAYTLWGTTNLWSYNPLIPWPRYMSIVTIPGTILVARWVMLLSSRVARWSVVLVLISSSLVCLSLENGRTVRTLGDGLLAFRGEHREKKMVVGGYAYLFMYVSNGLQPPDNVEIVGESWARSARRFVGSIQVHPDETSLRDCFVVLYVDPNQPPHAVPSDWKRLAEVKRYRRWFARQLDPLGGVFAKISEKLDPHTTFVIYYAPQ